MQYRYERKSKPNERYEGDSVTEQEIQSHEEFIKMAEERQKQPLKDETGDEVMYGSEYGDVGQNRNVQYISDNTAFMHWSTELEHNEDIMNRRFLQRNRHRVGDINKILALSNITSPRTIKLAHLRRMNMTLAKDAGLEELADETMLDNIADYQTSRGIEGFYQKALITQRRELLDNQKKEEKKGLLKSLFRGAEAQEEAQFVSEN